MIGLLRRYGNDETGSTTIEYALIATMIGVSLIANLDAIATSLNRYFEGVAEAL